MCCKGVVETRGVRDDDDDEGRLPLLPAAMEVVSFEAPPATEGVVVCM